ncbi:MAG: hypothetical protein NTW29_16125 [Bacteroidetes bacterium]|nr:hypothetical protein [Bacteroidota bacterium]
MKKMIPLLLVSAILFSCSKTATVDPAPTTDPPAPPALSAKFSIMNTINNDGVKEGDDIPVDNQSANAVSYQWELKYLATGNITTYTDKKPVLNLGCGDWTVKLTVTGSNGATASSSAPLLVYCKGRNAGGKDNHTHTGHTGE